ncbi:MULTISPECIES: FtsB family cell division protein [Actinomyces]|uniref:Septum formation initiator family protein n=1 Tax=Actinomyces respiraculi TaxID=2744574 RepID=A0A7T0LKW2_9ACTO|nr:MULTISPECIES: septum formation initiator family protein [Actinomyces]QPL05669.1 septum formation initiator family protein [Actinomyces respiraculi]
MSPRRPTPARPGSRPGARPSGRPASRAAAPAPGRSGDKPATPRATPRARTTRPEAAVSPGLEHVVLRVGGADGVAVPARVLIIALVLLGAFIVTFPSLRGYLSQRAQYDAVLHQIDEAEAVSTALEAELAKWQDDDYVRSQARERLSYVMPGETTYIVVGADDVEQEQTASASTSTASADTTPPWYEIVRESARVAGQTGQAAPTEPAQQGWSTAVPTVPTPSAPSADATDEP